MDIPVTVENVPFAWGAAFAIDIIIGLAMFATILRQNAPGWARGACCWIGWWTWASAFTLLINMVVGPTNPFSYHQIGVFTETMTNLGVLWWMTALTIKNWYVRGKDFEQIELLRAKIYAENMIKDIRSSYDRQFEKGHGHDDDAK